MEKFLYLSPQRQAVVVVDRLEIFLHLQKKFDVLSKEISSSWNHEPEKKCTLCKQYKSEAVTEKILKKLLFFLIFHSHDFTEQILIFQWISSSLLFEQITRFYDRYVCNLSTEPIPIFKKIKYHFFRKICLLTEHTDFPGELFSAIEQIATFQESLFRKSWNR